MTYNEVVKDLFTVDQRYYLAHCISGDYKLGKGIALKFEKRYKLRRRLIEVGTYEYPDCICLIPVFNLVTKETAKSKPTYDSLRAALTLMKQMAVKMKVKHIAMPRIGCGLDRLDWTKVSAMIIEIFNDTDIDILVCKQTESNIYS